jgi:hypothetical protein
MTHISRSTGIGLVVYGICTAAAFMAAGAPGGDYSDSAVTKYIATSHLPLATVLWYVSGIGALALLVVANGLRSQPSGGRLLSGLSTVGAATSLVGAFVCGGLAGAMVEGGTTVRDGVPHPVVYTIAEIGGLLAVCAPALCVGIAAIVLAARHAVTGWLRVFSVVAGICGILAPFFFTYFVFLVWTLVAGAVIAARHAPAPAPQPAPSLV